MSQKTNYYMPIRLLTDSVFSNVPPGRKTLTIDGETYINVSRRGKREVTRRLVSVTTGEHISLL